MPFIDKIKNVAHKFAPEKKPTSLPVAMNGGGMVPFDDEMPLSKPAIVFHVFQIFFTFLALCCYASVASFQAHWKIGVSGLSGFAIFIAVVNMFLSLFMVIVPVLYDKYNRMVRLARALNELRVAFILTVTGVSELLLISFISTISVWTQPGCKDATKDPHADIGEDFRNNLSGWCRTKKAASIFFWLGLAFWLATFALVIIDWRHGRQSLSHRRPKDPPFLHPAQDDAHSVLAHDSVRRPRDEFDAEDENEEEDDRFESPFGDHHQYTAPGASTAPGGLGGGRPSMDAYGAFSDPPPTGYAATTSMPMRSVPSLSAYQSQPPPQLPPIGFVSPPISPPPSQQHAIRQQSPSPTRSSPTRANSAIPKPPNMQGMSRTLALAYEDTGTTETTYEDPYEKVRASIGGRPGY